MKYKNLCLIILFCLSLFQSVFAKNNHIQKTNHKNLFHPLVIYNDDNRTEINEITDPTIQNLAKATVGIIHRSLLVRHSDRSTIDILSRYYGRSMGLCENERFYYQPSAPTCTGFLVAPDLIATAGHCVSPGGCPAKAILFNYQLNEKGEAPYSTQAENVFYCKEVLYREVSDEQDYALIRLDRAVINIAPLDLTDNTPTVGENLFTIGHPSGLPKKITTGATVLEIKNSFFKTNTDSYGGSSGSPLFNKDNQVVGILVRGEDDYISKPIPTDTTLSCKISRVCKDNECRGEDATNISFISQVLKNTVQ